MKAYFLIFAALTAAPIDGAQAACQAPLSDQLVKVEGHPFALETTADNCHVFVSLQTSKSGTVAVLDNEAGRFRLARTISLPTKVGGGLELSHDGHALAIAGYDGVVLLDADALLKGAPNPLIAKFDDGDRGAIYAQFSQNDRDLFVSEEQNATILVLDVSQMRSANMKRAAVGRIEVGKRPVGLALSSDGERLFATSQTMGGPGPCPSETSSSAAAEGALFVIDATKAPTDPRHAVLTAFAAGCSPVRVVTSHDGHSLWVSERGSNRVLGLDPISFLGAGSHHQAKILPVGKSPIGLAIRPDGLQLWVANSDRFGSANGSVTRIAPANPASARVLDILDVGHFPRDLHFMPNGTTLLLAFYADDAIGIHVTEDIK